MDFSVIVCTYNSKIDELKFTLDSLVNQKEVDFEIIVSDDGSKENNKDFIFTYFKNAGFNNFKTRFDEENNGTIVNIKKALMLASGKYVKIIGQGDALADKFVLKRVRDYMKHNSVNVLFSRMQLFYWKNERIVNINRSIPKFINPWIKDDYETIKENIIVFNDQISGASMYFEKNYCDKLMHLMYQSKTKYMEDLCQYFILLNDEKIYYYDEITVLYECKGGISNLHDGSNNKRIKEDKNNFLDYLFVNYKDEKYITRRKALEKIERTDNNKFEKAFRKILKEPKWLIFRLKRMFN